MEDGVHLAEIGQGQSDVTILKAETRLVCKMRDIAPVSGLEIVEADNVVAFGDQTIRHVRTDEARGSRQQYSHLASFRGKSLAARSVAQKLYP